MEKDLRVGRRRVCGRYSTKDSWGVRGPCTFSLRVIPAAQKSGKIPLSPPVGGGGALVANLVFYQLALIALVSVFRMRSWWGPSEPVAARPTTAKPLPPPRKRSTEPKPFPGLTRQPHCDACAQAVVAHREPPGVPPRLVSPGGRRRHIDTSQPGCPAPDCRSGGWLGRGNMTSHGHPSGDPWRQLSCSRWTGSFLDTHGTIVYGTRAAVELIVRVLACLAEG